MKKEFYSFIKLMACSGLALLIAGSLNAQDIIHPTSGTSNVTVFSGTPLSYSDSGGSSGSYSNSESGSVSFCPNSPGEMVTINFSVVDMETSSSGSGGFAGGCCWDGLTITDANGTLFVGCGEDSGDGGDACSSGAGENGPNDLEPGDSFTSTAANGCLTVAFSSDTSFSETGWEATVSTSGDGGGGGDCIDVTVNQFDAFGDGWNGNILEVRNEGGTVVESTTLVTGSSGTDAFCLPEGCYTVNVDGGIFDSEVSWEMLIGGEIVLIGGAPESGLALCTGDVVECEDNEVAVDLFDSFGDGWNGAILFIVDENDNVVGSATLPAGLAGSETFCLPDGCYTVDVSGGIFPSEISWDITINGVPALSGGAPELGLELSINTECEPSPTCEDGMQNGNETGVDCGGPDCPPCPPVDGLPFPWSGDDVGEDCNDFEYDSDTGIFSTVGCANNAIPGTTMDNVSFINQTICGDGEISAKIESVSPGGYGGLMIRESSDPGAKQVALFSNLSNSLRWEARYTTGAPKVVQNFVKPAPIWLKLVRQGDWVFGYYSSTGMTYNYVHAVYLPMSMCVQVGLAGFSYTPGVDVTANYSNVNVIGSGGYGPVSENPGVEIENADRQIANLYPNPANEMITIEFAAHAELQTQLILRNELGQLIEQRQIAPATPRIEWAIESLNSGLYFIEIHREGEVPQTLRFVKSR